MEWWAATSGGRPNTEHGLSTYCLTKCGSRRGQECMEECESRQLLSQPVLAHVQLTQPLDPTLRYARPMATEPESTAPSRAGELICCSASSSLRTSSDPAPVMKESSTCGPSKGG